MKENALESSSGICSRAHGHGPQLPKLTPCGVQLVLFAITRLTPVDAVYRCHKHHSSNYDINNRDDVNNDDVNKRAYCKSASIRAGVRQSSHRTISLETGRVVPISKT